MGQDFDKEIDALLRQTNFSASDAADSEHLTADEIAAFAENALPQTSPNVYTRHLASCGRCRTILKSVIELNAETTPTPAVSGSAIEPWHRRFFGFPALAYGLAGFVLIFAGLLAFSALRNGDETVEVSRVAENLNSINADSVAPSNSSYANQPFNTADNGNSDRGTFSNSNDISLVDRPNTAVSNAAPVLPGTDETKQEPKTANPPKEAEQDISERAAAASPAPPALAANTQSRIEGFDSAAATRQPRGSSSMKAAKSRPMLESEAAAKRRRAVPPVEVASEDALSAGLERKERRAANSLNISPDAPALQRTIAGRSFELKQQVWYDVKYGGQSTINVRRGSKAFNGLDADLRSIANAFSGTVIVVWRGKAYRFD